LDDRAQVSIGALKAPNDLRVGVVHGRVFMHPVGG
jgi:hypothetical protein